MTTAASFDVREISADKGYLTRNNAEVIEKMGATPFIPFKTTMSSSPTTRRGHACTTCSPTAEEFLSHYHKRSNVETVFAMIKAKFGDNLLSKTEGAQTNDVLSKVIAHNLCVLIQAFHELGVDPSFGAAPSPGTVHDVSAIAG